MKYKEIIVKNLLNDIKWIHKLFNKKIKKNFVFILFQVNFIIFNICIGYINEYLKNLKNRHGNIKQRNRINWLRIIYKQIFRSNN